MITHARKIDMYPASVPVVVHLSQYDDDFTLEFTMFSSVGAFTVETGTTAKIRGTKKDGKGYSANATINTTQKKVTVTGNQQMTAIAGRNVYELVLTRNNKVLSTANFILDVEPAAMDANTVESESVIQEIGESVNAYLDEHPEMVYQVDDTLSVAGAAADAKKTGDEIADLKSDLDKVFSDNAKTALLNCFQHVAWVDAQGQTYYDALEDALYADSYPRITAVFNAGVNVIYTDDVLDTLKPYLTVKMYQTKQDTGTEISANDYTLSGTLTEGTSTIIVKYNDLRTSVDITGVVDFYNIWEWSSDATGVNALSRMPSNSAEKIVDGVRRGIEYGSGIERQNNRRSFCVDRGKMPIINQSGQATEFYPVPIPYGATKLTATITPNTQQFASYVYRYEGDVNPDGYNYLMVAPSSISWKTGTDVVEFPAGENLFVGFNCRKNASSEQYTSETEPKMTIVFE